MGEMTMRFSSFDKLASKVADIRKAIWFTEGNYIADIDQFNVRLYRPDNLYSLWDKEELIAYITLSEKSEVDDVWVQPNYRGQKIFSKLLWFFKTRLGHNKLMLGKVHSRDMQEVVKGLSRFNKSWENMVTGEIHEFDVNTLDDYYDWLKSTDWRLILENDGNFSDWPMFTLNKQFILESYDWQIE